MKRFLLLSTCFLLFFSLSVGGRTRFFERQFTRFFGNHEQLDSVKVFPPSYLPLIKREASVRPSRQPVRIGKLRSTSTDKKYDGKDIPDRPISQVRVGTVPIEVSVSQTGARCYTVPIATTEGLRLTPTVSLQYNSQGGYGVCGYGWDIAGISKITVINKNLYYHGTIAPATCGPASAGAAYALDGVPLVTNVGALNTSYPLVTASGNILVSPVQSGQVITGFHVLYPDGKKGEYGVANSSNEVAYPIVSLEDIDGNKILYEYLTKGPSTGNQYLVSRISYGIRGSQAALAEIDFEYFADQPYHTTYYAGVALDNRERLNGISSICGGEILYKYHLMYDQYDDTDFLTEIKCTKQLSSIKLNSLEFGYYFSEPEPFQERMYCRNSINSVFWNTDDLYLERGRFFSEHCSDGLISYPNFSPYGIIQQWNDSHKYGSLFASNQPLAIVPNVDDYICQGDTLLAGTGFQGLLTADVNGDGKDELVKLGYAGVNGDKTKLRVSTYSINNNGHSLIMTSVVEVDGKVQEGSFTSPLWRHFMIGDFLGTGKAQLMTISFDKSPSGNSRTSYCDLINLNTGVRISGFTCPFSVASDGPLPVAVDLEGDGRTEIVQCGSNVLNFYRLSSDSQMSFLYSSPAISPFSPSSLFSKANFTDINGDGHLDILMNAGGTDWIMCQNTGNGCVLESLTFGSNRSDSFFMFVDVDSNNFADLVEVTSDGEIYSYTNVNGVISTNAITCRDTVSSNNNVLPVNISRFGGNSSFIKISGPFIKVFDYTINRGAHRLLTDMVDGYGKIQYNYYDKLSGDDMSVSYNVEQYAPLPAGYRLLSGNIYLLSMEDTWLAETGAYPIFTHHDYWYTDAIMNTEGLGFIGFNKTETYDLQGNYVQTWNNTQMMGVPVRRRTYVNSHLAEKDSLIYDANIDQYKKMNPLLRKSYHTDVLTGTLVEKEITYGTYDFPHISQTKWYNGSTQDARLYETYQYNHKTSSADCYVLGSITELYQSSELDGNLLTLHSRKTSVSYDASMRPTEISEYLRDTTDLAVLPTLSSHRTLTYNSYGDVLSDKTALYGEPTHLGNTMTYDMYGRTATITNSLGQTTTIGLYNDFGKPLSVTDHKNRQTGWSYDEFGRPTSCTYPDGTVETRSVVYGGIGRYVVTITKTGEPDSETHFDSAGRVLRSSVMGHDGIYIVTDREYDEPMGRLSRVSLPRLATDTTRCWNTFSYDTLNRPVLCHEASGKTTSWAYNGLSFSETKEGVTRTITKDAAGNVLSVTDPGGTITFTLRDDGQPSVVTTPGSITRSFKYDIFGRRTSISDPSLGTRTTTYSFIFNHRYEYHTTPSGAFFVHYDTLGRRSSIMRTRWDAPSITYQYNADGFLSSATSDNGAGETYTYDTYDRIASVISTTNNGKSFKKEFTYGPGSKVASIKYTEPGLGEICTENYTYTYGHHTKTALSNGTTVYELLSANAFGFPTSVKTGTVTRTYTYSNYGLPTGRQTGTAIGEVYSFNAATGNLMEWSDTLAGRTTTYGYDLLNRIDTTGIKGLEYNIFGSRSMYHSGANLYPKLEYNDSSDPYKLTEYYRNFHSHSSFPFQTVTYNTADRPATISDNGYLATINYDGEGNRVSMVVSQNNSTILSKSYLGGKYEIETNDTTTFRRLYIGGDYYSAPAVLIKNGSGNWTFYNIIRDYLGSVRCLAASDGTPVETCSYDAWGEITAGYLPSIGRGYTGHEHLPWFGLINMNARLYDPLVGRFLSPDPYIQDPYSTQNFNRYAYALNNPLKYNDKSGEFFGLTLLLLGNDPILYGIGNLIAHSVRGENLGHGKWAKYLGQGMFAGIMAGFLDSSMDVTMMAIAGIPGIGIAGQTMLALSKSFWASQGPVTDFSMFASLFKEGGFNRGLEIWLGNFYIDENAGFWEGAAKGALRRTWEGAQSALGYIASQSRNGFGDVSRVDYLGGATFTTVEKNGKKVEWGMTLGNFINMDIMGEVVGDFNTYVTETPMFMHEYGHTIDSRKYGPLYNFGVGLPSLISAQNSHPVPDPRRGFAGTVDSHSIKPYEVSANRNASKYFRNYYQVDWSQYEKDYPTKL